MCKVVFQIRLDTNGRVVKNSDVTKSKFLRDTCMVLNKDMNIHKTAQDQEVCFYSP